MLLAFKIYIIIGELIALGCLFVPDAGPTIFKALDDIPPQAHWPVAIISMMILALSWPYLIIVSLMKACK